MGIGQRPDKPLRIRMQRLREQSFRGGALDNAARLATSVATPIDDMRGTAEFRRHIVGVLTRRVLTIAAERARDSEQR